MKTKLGYRVGSEAGSVTKKRSPPPSRLSRKVYTKRKDVRPKTLYAQVEGLSFGANYAVIWAPHAKLGGQTSEIVFFSIQMGR